MNAAEQELAAERNPLLVSGILRNVFKFLPGHWLFLGAVCREWETVYAGMPEQHVLSTTLKYMPRRVVYSSKNSLYSAAVASPATARLADSSGLAISEKKRLSTDCWSAC
eukprot:2536-Heterococcus_DN1.PRE.6